MTRVSDVADQGIGMGLSIPFRDKDHLTFLPNSVRSQCVEQEVETALAKEREGQPLDLTFLPNSVRSQCVEQEVKTALAKEREGQPLVLFPIRLDETVIQRAGGWPTFIRNTCNIGDFTRWKRRDDYQQALERLLRDLKAEEKAVVAHLRRRARSR